MCDAQELEMRIDTQKQTLSARDESIKKLLEMLQTKGEGKEEEARVHQQMQMVAQKQVDRPHQYPSQQPIYFIYHNLKL